MIAVQEALQPNLSQVAVKGGKYQFEAYIDSSGRYFEGPKEWDVRAWQSFDPVDYTPFTPAPCKSTMQYGPFGTMPISPDGALVCLPAQMDRLFKEIGQGQRIDKLPLDGTLFTGVPNWDPEDPRRCAYLHIGNLDFNFGELLAKRLAKGTGPDGWGAPGNWAISGPSIAFVFDTPTAAITKPTDWTPARKLSISERTLLTHELSGDFLLESTDQQVGRNDFTQADRDLLQAIAQKLGV